MIPAGGPDPAESFAEGFFAVAATLSPKPATVALVGADAEFAKNAVNGAREAARKYGFRVVYDRTYPPSTADYSPIVRAIAATHPDLVFVGSYPPDTVGMIRAAHEVGLKTRDVRRRHGRPAGGRHQDGTRPAAERHRRL